MSKKSLGKSRYPYWTQRNGEKIRLEEMSDAHLVNTIKLLERGAHNAYPEQLKSAMVAYSFMQGEMACMEMESIIESLECGGWEELLPSIYYNMLDEQDRRVKVVASEIKKSRNSKKK